MPMYYVNKIVMGLANPMSVALVLMLAALAAGWFVRFYDRFTLSF